MIWVAGRSFSQSGIEFAPNLPTEEVFTIAHRTHVDGTVRSTKPLSYGGTLIEDFTLRFEQGRVVNATAARGDDVLRRLIDTDDGAGRLGEVALVPHSSLISQTGRLFYNTLFDDQQRETYKKQLAQGSSSSEEHQKALKVLEGEMAFRRGEILLRKNDFMGALAEFESAHAANPHSVRIAHVRTTDAIAT